MSTTDGVVRGTKVVNTGAPITVPVGEECLGRVFNLLGEPVDDGGPVNAKQRRPIHAPAAALPELEHEDGDLRDGHQGRRPARALRARAARPASSAARASARPSSSWSSSTTSPQQHGGYSVFCGVGERTREGNDLWLEMQESGVIDKAVLVLRPDERAARRAPARRALGPDDGGVLPRRGGRTCSSSSTTSSGSRRRAPRCRRSSAACRPPSATSRRSRREMGELAGADHLDDAAARSRRCRPSTCPPTT